MGGSDQPQEDAFRFPPARGERPANTETYYAEQYDQYYRYGLFSFRETITRL